MSGGGNTERISEKCTVTFDKTTAEADPHGPCQAPIPSNFTLTGVNPGLAERWPPEIMACSELILEFPTNGPPSNQTELYMLSNSGS